VPRKLLTSRPSRSRPATLKPPKTATRSMANAMAASAGARERGPGPTALALASRRSPRYNSPPHSPRY
jgi:hypothetical protein